MSRHPWYRHAVPLAMALSLYVPAVAAGQGVPEPHVPISTTLGDIAELRAAYVDAFNAKDAKAVAAMYTADAISIGVDGSQTVGARAIGKMFADSAANWPHAVINSVSLKVYGATAVDVGTWTVHPKAGGEMVSRYLAVLRHDVKGWKLQYVANVPVPK
jgi:uncharacterized protein (TIGR02246 family)